MKDIQGITIKDFVSRILMDSKIVDATEDAILYAYQKGWVEEQDIVHRAQPLERRHAARIIHEFLRMEQKEADETEVGSAEGLKDLYDCRVCVRHVMQVYAKGIMEGFTNSNGQHVFGMNQWISEFEMEEILNRLFHERARKKPAVTKQEGEARQLTATEVLEQLKTEEKYLLIDVRTPEEYVAGHMQNAVQMSMMSILKNPYQVSLTRDIPLYLYCEQGYQSRLAANCLAEAGFEKVVYFAWAP